MVRLHFELGSVILSEEAKELKQSTIEWVLDCHQTGDFGDIPEWRAKLNWVAIAERKGRRIESAYLLDNNEMVWVRTEDGNTTVWMF